MTAGWLRSGRSSVPSCRLRQRRWLRSGAGRWAASENLHQARVILRELEARFGSGPPGYGPYYFADLAGVSEADEQAVIDEGLIQPGRIQYAGRRR